MPLPPELKQEIASVERDINYVVYGGVLPNPDETLLKRGGGKGLKLYDEIEEDTHAYAVLQKRKLAVIARPWEVKAASDKRLDKKAADLLRADCEKKLDRLTLELLDANLKGFAVSEIMWMDEGEQYSTKEFKARDQRRFAFLPDNSLRLLTRQNMVLGEGVPDRKFIRHSFGAKDGNPFGNGLGSKLYFPVWFKRQGISFWLIFCEKFGMPTAVGKYEQNASEADQKKLLDALRALAQDAGVIIPEGMEITLLEATRSSTADLYERLVRYMDEQISECVLGETLTTNIGSVGSKAAADTHDGVRLEVSKADADLLSQTLNNTYCKWFTELTVPGANPPTIWRVFDEEEDLNSRSQRDKTLFDMGFKLTLDAVKEIYGDHYEVEQQDDITPDQFLKNSGVDQPSPDASQPEDDNSPGFAELEKVFALPLETVRFADWLGNQVKPHSFAEDNQIPIQSREDLLSLRNILEAVYLDGISAIPEAYLDGENFIGIFEDEVSDSLVKKFNFTLSESGVEYKLINPDDVDNFAETEIEFAKNNPVKKKKNCTKGVSCGGGCISPAKTCRKGAGEIPVKEVTELKKKVKKPKPEVKKPKPQAEEINYKIDRSDYKALIGLGEQFAQQYIKGNSTSPKLEELIAQKNQVWQEVLARGKKGALQKQKKLMNDLDMQAYQEKRRLDSEGFVQMQRLKDAVIEKNGISLLEAEQWSNSRNYTGSRLATDSGAIDTVKQDLAEVYRLSGGKAGNSVRDISADAERAYAGIDRGSLEVGKEFDKITAFHEYSHPCGATKRARMQIE